MDDTPWGARNAGANPHGDLFVPLTSRQQRELHGLEYEGSRILCQNISLTELKRIARS